jgi:hypothetical protein
MFIALRAYGIFAEGAGGLTGVRFDMALLRSAKVLSSLVLQTCPSSGGRTVIDIVIAAQLRYVICA